MQRMGSVWLFLKHSEVFGFFISPVYDFTFNYLRLNGFNIKEKELT